MNVRLSIRPYLRAPRFSFELLLCCTQLSNKRTYEELAEQALGRVGRQVR